MRAGTHQAPLEPGEGCGSDLGRDAPGANDSLRFEKRMIDDWARTEFRNPAVAGR